jgi:hypothetical protein
MILELSALVFSLELSLEHGPIFERYRIVNHSHANTPSATSPALIGRGRLRASRISVLGSMLSRWNMVAVRQGCAGDLLSSYRFG